MATKKLIEVALPLEYMNSCSEYEKNQVLVLTRVEYIIGGLGDRLRLLEVLFGQA